MWEERRMNKGATATASQAQLGTTMQATFFRSHPQQSPSKKNEHANNPSRTLFAQRSSRVPTHFSLRKTGEKDVIAPNISSMNKTTQTHQSRENSLSVSFRKAACTQFPLLLFFSVWQYQASCLPPTSPPL